MDVVPAELLIPASPQERGRVDRSFCSEVLDPLLLRLARQEALCRRVVGGLARFFRLRRGHQRLGFARLDDYARERLGLSGRELQDLAHVVERLETLPAIARAFAEGALSWSHLRLLVRIADRDTEAVWLTRARTETVRGLDAAIAAARGATPDTDDETVDGEPRERFHIRCPRRVRRLWRHAGELASRMSGTRLAAARAAEAIAAEGLASDVGHAAPDMHPAPDPVPRCHLPLPDGAWATIAEALPDDVERLLIDVPFIDPFELDARLQASVRALQRIDFQMGRLLRLVAQLRLHRAFGFHSLTDYVRERLGCSARKTRALVALDRRLAELPDLAGVYRSGHLSFARALVLLPVVRPENEAAWVARAREVTIRRLGDEVDWALEVGASAPPSPETAPVLPPLDEVQMCAAGCDAEIRFDAPSSIVALLRSAIRAWTPRAVPAWQGLERLLRHVISEWERRPRHRDPIFERDGWRCAVPACTARTSLQDHHVVYRSRGGSNTRDNRVAICAAHHLNGIHKLRIKVAGVAPHDLTWEIGFRRGRPPLLRTHGDRYLDGALAAAPRVSQPPACHRVPLPGTSTSR
jgi:hypothetical protein